VREAVRLLLDLHSYWLSSAVQEGLDLVAQISPTVNATEAPELDGEIRLFVGSLYQVTGDFPVAERHLRDAVRILRETPTSDRYAESLIRLGSALVWQDKIDEAMPFIDQAEAAAENSRDRALLADVWAIRGVIAARTGDPSAERIVRRYVEIAREASSGALGMALNNLGDLVMRRDPATAIPILQEALDILAAYNDRIGVRYASTTLGEAFLLVGDPRQAAPHLQRAYEQSREIGDDLIAAESALSLAVAYAQLGDEPRAVATWSHANRTKPEAVRFDPGTLLLVNRHLEPLRLRTDLDFEDLWQRGADPRFSVANAIIVGSSEPLSS
jgi:tetratricopeptide (TPR) repeat protein